MKWHIPLEWNDLPPLTEITHMRAHMRSWSLMRVREILSEYSATQWESHQVSENFSHVLLVHFPETHMRNINHDFFMSYLRIFLMISHHFFPRLIWEPCIMTFSQSSWDFLSQYLSIFSRDSYESHTSWLLH